MFIEEQALRARAKTSQQFWELIRVHPKINYQFWQLSRLSLQGVKMQAYRAYAEVSQQSRAG
jgi:hypothetical protein